MQAAVPQGEKLLVLLSWPSLLDFQRNPIFVMDHPAEIGPPGLPPANDAAAWSRYLRSLGIDYVAYSYGDQAVYTKEWALRDIAQYSRPESRSRLMIEFATAHIAMRETLLTLAHTHKLVYDDGKEFVIYLDQG